MWRRSVQAVKVGGKVGDKSGITGVSGYIHGMD